MYHELFVRWLLSRRYQDKRVDRTVRRFSNGPRWAQLRLVRDDLEVRALHDEYDQIKPFLKS